MNADDIRNKNLSELDSDLFIRIRNHLDICNSSVFGWRNIVENLRGIYKLSCEEVFEISNCQRESPTELLFKKLISRAMTIDEFISCATRAGDAVILDIFNVHIAVRITDHSPPDVLCEEGEVLTLSVKAIGLPAPQYQWFKGDRPIRGASHAHLEICNVQLEDAGQYRCIVYQGRDVSSRQLTNTSHVRVTEAPDVEIRQHPQITCVGMGGNALLTCRVRGPTTVKFQWFNGGTLLEDGPNIKGSNTSELHLYNINRDMLGCYLCRISWGNKFTETKGAAVQISEILQNSSHKFEATDKVALLIRCADYRGDYPLSASNNDVQTLASIFTSLNFKVLSFLNLTKKEILVALHEFRKLIGPGVYCVFYFCGHGYDVSKQVYLVPCDAPQGYTTDHCISEDRISNIILNEQPELFCMILDVCRKHRDVLPPVLIARDPVITGNRLVVYGTSYGLSAYEDGTHGILVSHLKNFLSLPISVEEVFQRFRKSIQNDLKLMKNMSKKQIPEVGSNLRELDRSFADPIVYKGHTQEFNYRKSVWEEAHRLPSSKIKVVHFPDFSVKVQLDFDYEFSNKLKIFTTVLDQGLAQECRTWVDGIPNYVAEKTKNHIAQKEGCHHSRNCVELPNIHRFKNNIIISILVVCRNPNHRAKFEVDLGLPLCSALELWRYPPELNPSRQPQEVDESLTEQQLRDLVLGHSKGGSTSL